MDEQKPKILLTFRIGGENGGPYVSHKRILESALNQKYDIYPLMIDNPRKLRRWRNFWHVVRCIKQANPDLVHLAGLGSEGFLMMIACRFARVKTVVAVHGSSTEAIGYNRFTKWIFKQIEKYTLKKADAVYGVSDYVSSWRVCRYAKKYLGTIYNIPYFSSIETDKLNIRDELKIAPTDIVIVSTGRITEDKGYDTLLRVILKLRDYNNIKFIISGEGYYRKKMVEELQLFKSEKNTFLLGFRSDVDEILKAADIFVICTKHETLCNSLLEAGALSLPLVASNVGGIPEIIDDGKNGFLIEPNDVDGFVHAILKLAQDAKLRKDMGSMANSKIATTFDVQNILKKLDLIYQSVL